ncbi:hypothetical protein ACROYT_G026601 [Oculina patagonica]
MKLPFAIVLLFSSIAVYSTFAGRISDKIREKRSYEYNCEEKVFSSSPICNKKTCPDGIHGRPEFKRTKQRRAALKNASAVMARPSTDLEKHSKLLETASSGNANVVRTKCQNVNLSLLFHQRSRPGPHQCFLHPDYSRPNETRRNLGGSISGDLTSSAKIIIIAVDLEL